MAESVEAGDTRRIVTSGGMDRGTKILLWAVSAAILMLIALVAYAWLTGGFTSTAPRTAEERSLAVTEEAIKKNPAEGSSYAIRAETLYRLGRKQEAFQTLDQGEKAVGGKNPGLLYILRSRTTLLNAEKNYPAAEQNGIAAVQASDQWLAQQAAVLKQKGVNDAANNINTQVSVDVSLQLAEAYVAQKKWAKAIDLYTYGLKLDPLAADVLTLRGYAYLGSGQKAKAKADFLLALKYLPDSGDAAVGLKQAEAATQTAK